MNTIFINSENSRISDPHRLLLNLVDNIDLRRKEKIYVHIYIYHYIYIYVFIIYICICPYICNIHIYIYIYYIYIYIIYIYLYIALSHLSIYCIWSKSLIRTINSKFHLQHGMNIFKII